MKSFRTYHNSFKTVYIKKILAYVEENRADRYSHLYIFLKNLYHIDTLFNSRTFGIPLYVSNNIFEEINSCIDYIKTQLILNQLPNSYATEYLSALEAINKILLSERERQ